jgi:hypothetical protein
MVQFLDNETGAVLTTPATTEPPKTVAEEVKSDDTATKQLAHAYYKTVASSCSGGCLVAATWLRGNSYLVGSIFNGAAFYTLTPVRYPAETAWKFQTDGQPISLPADQFRSDPTSIVLEFAGEEKPAEAQKPVVSDNRQLILLPESKNLLPAGISAFPNMLLELLCKRAFALVNNLAHDIDYLAKGQDGRWYCIRSDSSALGQYYTDVADEMNEAIEAYNNILKFKTTETPVSGN